MSKRFLLDTSVLVAKEPRQVLAGLEDGDAAISVITLGELHAGVLASRDGRARAGRLARLAAIEAAGFEVLPVTVEVARAFGQVVGLARGAGRRPKATDALIAATARVYGLVVVSRDRDFQHLDVDAVIVP